MPPTLFDATGRPVDVRALTTPADDTTVAGVRPLGFFPRHPADGITPQRLSALLRMAEYGDTISYLELAEQMEERDLHYRAVLGVRKRSVVQLPLQVVAAGDDADSVADAELVRDALNRDELADELFDLCDAIGKGYSILRVVWETSARSWMPRSFTWRDPRWFRPVGIDGRSFALRTEDNGAEPLPPYAFITHTGKEKSGAPVRGGIARIASWAYLFKNYNIKDWASFIETFGQPFRVGKYEPGATAEDKQALLSALVNIGADAAAMIPRSMLLEFLEVSRSSTDMYERAADWWDRQVSKVVLGQTGTTEVKGGSYAAAKVHNEVRGDIQAADAAQVAATLNQQFVRPVVDLNRGPRKRYPRVVLRLPRDRGVADMADAIGTLVDRGLELEQSVVRDELGFPEPGPGAKLLSPFRKDPAVPPHPAPVVVGPEDA